MGLSLGDAVPVHCARPTLNVHTLSTVATQPALPAGLLRVLVDHGRYGTMKDMTNRRWWSSDHHFSHRNIVPFCDRPYREPNHPYEPAMHYMNTDLVSRHNQHVNPDDEVWFLGDLALGNTARNLVWAKQCNGIKTFLAGNHDKNFRRDNVERPGWDNKYRDGGGFETVLHGTVPVTLADGTDVLVSHFPYANVDHSDTRYSSRRPIDDGATWLLHGHVHEKWRQRGRMINVGVDAWGGNPVAEETLLELIHGGPTDREPLPWK